ncbi:short-chain dehydrogenase [Chimaeribacter californicus]|uniref:Short-chain dehydrogenase n=1 Tax=Chimaeribacter californicus TaxID=2060067 RepID=A0A2N5E517_9GAMM|nr:SDR family oxidoreductase [Chimaeribacter californicus]PLR36259.1 short-chain dehydrogenase [Chimaeribacter californicus]
MNTTRFALVTGANKGIGKEIARQLAQQGYHVFLGCRDAERGREAQADLESAGKVEFVALDVTDSASIAAAAAQVEARAGWLDLLVNNAGIALDAAPPSQVKPEDIRATYEVNVLGPVMVTQAFLPLLRQGEQKNIINVSSELGSLNLHSYPDFAYHGVNIFSYNSSKTALNAFTVLLAKELKPEGIRVNAVNPGYTATDLNQHSGPLPPEEAAAAIVHYAVQGADGPTGGFFVRDGQVPW